MQADVVGHARARSRRGLRCTFDDGLLRAASTDTRSRNFAQQATTERHDMLGDVAYERADP